MDGPYLEEVGAVVQRAEEVDTGLAHHLPVASEGEQRRLEEVRRLLAAVAVAVLEHEVQAPERQLRRVLADRYLLALPVRVVAADQGLVVCVDEVGLLQRLELSHRRRADSNREVLPVVEALRVPRLHLAVVAQRGQRPEVVELICERVDDGARLQGLLLVVDVVVAAAVAGSFSACVSFEVSLQGRCFRKRRLLQMGDLVHDSLRQRLVRRVFLNHHEHHHRQYAQHLENAFPVEEHKHPVCSSVSVFPSGYLSCGFSAAVRSGVFMACSCSAPARCLQTHTPTAILRRRPEQTDMPVAEKASVPARNDRTVLRSGDAAWPCRTVSRRLCRGKRDVVSLCKRTLGDGDSSQQKEGGRLWKHVFASRPRRRKPRREGLHGRPGVGLGADAEGGSPTRVGHGQEQQGQQ